MAGGAIDASAIGWEAAVLGVPDISNNILKKSLGYVEICCILKEITRWTIEKEVETCLKR